MQFLFLCSFHFLFLHFNFAKLKPSKINLFKLQNNNLNKHATCYCFFEMQILYIKKSTNMFFNNKNKKLIAVVFFLKKYNKKKLHYYGHKRRSDKLLLMTFSLPCQKQHYCTFSKGVALQILKATLWKY